MKISTPTTGKSTKGLSSLQTRLQQFSWLRLSLIVMMLTGAVVNSQAQFSIVAAATNYTQNFNSLTGGAWADNTTLTGWYSKTDATASITTYAANTGSTTTAGLYAFGVAGTGLLSDRALGLAPSNGFTGGSGTGKGYIGWRLKNATGAALASIQVTWTGEQWRKDNTVVQSLILTYQQGATVTNISAGSWTATGSTFNSPIITTGGAALDGNTPANRTAGITATITVNIPAGEEIVLRWEDLNDAGNDHFLAIDDVTITASAAASAPTVTTIATPSALGITTATLNGNVTADGGNTITARGIVYAETATIATPTIGSPGVINATSAGTTGAFSVSVTGLSANTQYSYRAYATNTIGTSYGGASGTSFYTLANTPNAPVVNGATSASLDVAIGTGDANSAGTEYAIQETGSGNYVQTGGALGATAVWNTAATWGAKTVTGLSASTSYSFQVKARNGAAIETGFGATAGGTTLSAASPVLTTSPLAAFGTQCINTASAPNTFTITGSNLTNADITVASLNGFSFSADGNPYTASLTIAQAGGSFSKLISVIFTPTLVQSYNGNIVISGGGATSINEAVTAAGVNTVPAVTTGSATAITQISATLNGTLGAAGCSPVTSYGLEYSTLTGFANGSGTAAASVNLSGGAFSSNITGLSANTVYYYHAYATSTSGTGYGAQQTFTTSGLVAPVATAATAIAGNSFTANWNAVTGADHYRLDVSTSPTFASSNATDLFFSEYVEGSSNNKYIEIYNGTGASVSLSDYKLQLFANGSLTTTSDVTLSGTLANGSTIVYKNSGATVYGGTAISNASINYNGDDAIALYKISTSSFVDIFGRIGEDPGTNWLVGGNTTLDKTLVRNANIASGVTVNPAAGFPTLGTQWVQSNIDVVTNLGTHTYSVNNPSFVSGYNNLLVNGTSQSVTGLAVNTTYYYRVRAESTNSTSANSNTITAVTICSASVVVSQGANGTITPSGTTSYNCGDNPVFNINPNACYSIVDVVADGLSVGPVTSYTFTNISNGNHTLTATYSANTYTVTASSTGAGTISPAGVSVVNCAANITYNFTADACNSIADVLVDGVSVGALSTYTFNNVQLNHTISVSFIVTPYTISVSYGPNGSITPATGTVNCGTNATYTITPNSACFNIADVLVDGVSVGAVASYTFTNVTANHTISATFAATTYTITATAGANGTVTPAGASVVNCGTDNTYTITPAACYHVDDVLVDGVSVGAITSYTFTNTGADHTISASFVLNTALAAPVVTGFVNVCPFIGTGENITYTFNAAGATSYSTILPPNVTLVSSTTNSITVNFQNGFAAQPNKQIKVTGLSPCGNSPQTIYYLLAQAPGTPAAISGSANVCPVIGTAATLTYSITPVTGATAYVWTAQAGTTTITHPNGAGANDYTVTVSFTTGFTTSPISVQAVNGCGTSNSRSLTLVRANAATPGLISGPTNVCSNIAPGGTAATYSVTAVAGVTYNWTIPAGSSGFTGQGTASVSFTYPVGFTSGNVSVTASNGCGVSAPRSLSVSKLAPSAPSAIDVVPAQACPNRIYTYSLSAVPNNATSVQWTVPAAAISFTGQGTASITITYPSTAVTGTVTATAVNNCGSSLTRSSTVSLPACEDGPPPPPPPGPRAYTTTTAPVSGSMEVNVYPNPSVSSFNLQVITAGKDDIRVRITDMQGRSLKQLVVKAFTVASIGADLKAGAYIMEVRQGNEVKTTKLLKF